MTTRLAAVLLCGTAIYACCMLFGNAASGGDSPAAEKRLQKLLGEKHSVLLQRAKRLEQLHAVDLVDRSAVTQARIDAFDSQLQLTKNKSSRLKILEQRVALYRNLEKTAQLRLNAPIPPRGGKRPAAEHADLAFQATATRLQAEIDLERERLRPTN